MVRISLDTDLEQSISSQPSTDASSESSESVEECSETGPLLPKGLDSSLINYDSTSIVAPVEAQSENDHFLDDEQLAAAKNVYAIISLLLIGVFIANADGSLVLATYGTISSEFDSFGDASWLTTGFTLATCAVQPLAGKLSDVYGRKAVLLVSYVLFAGGSIVTGAGRSMGEVILGRVITGVGAAGMTVLVSIVITDLVPLIQVASWRSYVNVVATLGRSIGGPLGGLLADTIGWRWSFIGQGPLITLAIVLVAVKLPSETNPTVSIVQQKGQPSKLRRIDFIGAISLALAIVSLLGALSLGGQDLPWGHPVVISMAAGSVALGFLFVVWEKRYALEPVFPPALVVRRDIAVSYLIMAFQTAAQVSMMYTVPLYFRATQNSSNTVAGSHLFPAVVGNAIGGLISGYIIQKTGRYKALTIIATISSSISYLLLVLRWHGNISILESLEIVPGGFGNGITAASVFIALTSSVKPTEMAICTGGMYLASSVGMVVSLAVSSAVQMSSLKVFLGRGLGGINGSKKIIQRVISDVGSIAGLKEPLHTIVIDAYVKSFEYSHAVSLICSLIAFCLALTVREHRLR